MKINGWIYALMIASLGWAACDDDDNNNDNDVDRSLPATDRNFVEQAAMGNMAEVNFGQLAVTKGSDSLVRAFGQHMVTEHTTAQDELKEIADDFNNVTWPTELDSAHREIREQLETLEGYSFDSLYMSTQVMDHEKTIDLFETEISQGEEQRVESYATKYLPHIQEHYEQADSIRTVITDMQNNAANGN